MAGLFQRVPIPRGRGRRQDLLLELAAVVGPSSTRRLAKAAIERFTRQWNDGASAFIWVKTPGEILATAVRKA